VKATIFLRSFCNSAIQRLKRISEKGDELRRNLNRSSIVTARMLATFFIVVAGLDIVSTNAALVAGQVEGNLLIREIQTHLGAWWSVPKVLFHLILAFLILWHPSRKMIAIARVVVVGYLAIFINNSYFAGWLA